MHSAIYRGWLRHRRFAPRPHQFRYGLFMVYLDLSEVDSAFRGHWLWRAVARFRREDHLGDASIPLDQAVRDLVQRETGKRPEGRIALLTHLRYFGYCFNPVSFYYCFNGDTVETVVAEVNNTPWGERHCYVLDGRWDLRFRTAKEMHVSPFMPMDLAYDWRFTVPGERLGVGMALERGGEKVFDATLALAREPVSNGVLLRFPFMTLKVIATIHWQALKLWLKRVPVHTHPARIPDEVHHDHQHQRP